MATTNQTNSETMVEVRNITKYFGDLKVLKGVNFKVNRGEVVCILGPSGSGKSTMLRCLNQLERITDGEIYIEGELMDKRKNNKTINHINADRLQQLRCDLGMVFQNFNLFPHLNVIENVTVAPITVLKANKEEITKRGLELLDMVGLNDTGRKSVHNFSLGMRQRLGIAIALLNTPEFLILDEPINGLDPAGIVEIRNLLKSLNKKYGMTILVSSHILEELYQTATEFILIDKGKIIEELSDRELNEQCRRHIAIKTTDPQKTLLVLEERLHTENFKLFPDGVIRLYDFLDNMEEVASALSDAHILVTGLSLSGDTLEDYFLSKIGGASNVKSSEC